MSPGSRTKLQLAVLAGVPQLATVAAGLIARSSASTQADGGPRPDATVIPELTADRRLKSGTSAADHAAITSTRARMVAICSPFHANKKDLRGSAVLSGVRLPDTPYAADGAAANARGAGPDEGELHPVQAASRLQRSGRRP